MPYKVPAENWDKFIAAFAKSGNLSLAAKAAGIGRRTVQLRIKRDGKFRSRYDDAAQNAIDLLEAEARRRAVQGVRTPIIRGGKPVAYVRRYSDGLLMFLLRAHRFGLYGGCVKPGAAEAPPPEAGSARERIMRRLNRLVARRAAGGDPPASGEGGSGGA